MTGPPAKDILDKVSSLAQGTITSLAEQDKAEYETTAFPAGGLESEARAAACETLRQVQNQLKQTIDQAKQSFDGAVKDLEKSDAAATAAKVQSAAAAKAADAALKAGTVRLVLSRSICSGKYMVLIAGEPSAVQSAIQAGCDAATGCLIDSFVITNIHPDVITALGRTSVAPPEGALGILESFNVATLIRAADAAAKSAPVQLFELIGQNDVGFADGVDFVGQFTPAEDAANLAVEGEGKSQRADETGDGRAPSAAGLP